MLQKNNSCFCQINVSAPLAMMYMFVHYIYTKYMDAYIYQSLNPRLMEAYQGLNHQTISKFYIHKKKV
jgi:hypothetical protein